MAAPARSLFHMKWERRPGLLLTVGHRGSPPALRLGQKEGQGYRHPPKPPGSGQEGREGRRERWVAVTLSNSHREPAAQTEGPRGEARKRGPVWTVGGRILELPPHKASKPAPQQQPLQV